MAVAAIPYMMAALGAASTLSQADAANKSAAAQNRSLLLGALANNQMQAAQNKSMADQTGQQLGTLATQAMAERARLTTLAGEGGVSGGLLDRLNNEINFKQGDASANILQTNMNNQMTNYYGGKVNQAQTQSQANQIESQAKQMSPGPLGLGLRIAGQFGNAYMGQQAGVRQSTNQG